jgi:hypothetical protein
MELPKMRKQRHQHQHDQADHGGLVAAKAAAGIGPWAAALDLGSAMRAARDCIFVLSIMAQYLILGSIHA